MNRPPAPAHELEQRLQAWVDGELPTAEAREVAALVERDPAARALADNLRALAAVLRQEEPVREVPVSRDFYWSGIRQGIERADREQARTEAPPANPNPMRWLAWLLPAGAAALAAAVMLQPSPSVPTRLTSSPALTDHVVETPSDEVSSLTFYAAQDNLTVVWLGRLDFM